MHCWMTEWRKKRHITQHTYLNTDTRLHCNVLNTEYVTHTHAFQGHKSRWWGGGGKYTHTESTHNKYALAFFRAVRGCVWGPKYYVSWQVPTATSSVSVCFSLCIIGHKTVSSPKHTHANSPSLSFPLSLALNFTLYSLSHLTFFLFPSVSIYQSFPLMNTRMNVVNCIPS